jgi:DNA-binding NtrC family response regulator
MGRILVVGDLAARSTIMTTLVQDGHQISECGGLTEARKSLAINQYDALFASQLQPNGDSLALLTVARNSDPTLAIVLLCTATETEFTVKNKHLDTFGLLMVPFQPEVVRAMAFSACEYTRLLRENLLLKKKLELGQKVSPDESKVPQFNREQDHAISGAANPRSERFDLTVLLEQTEKTLIAQMLSLTGGAQAEAARRMGLSRSALAYKLKKYGIRTHPM